ncbi:MAG TPA: hypothetical protein VHS27_10910 [Gaiellales bacterium]|jgi:hypothetical protein|nr:hypothetical protein [Gaiellales bacterium]
MADATREARTPEDARVEFAAYRQEILHRSSQQYTLLALDLTALTAIAGFVLSDNADRLLLLLLPIVSGSIGLLWYDHARNIDSLGSYILENMQSFAGYEQRIDELEVSELRRVPMTLALLVLLVGAPISGLIVTFRDVHGSLWALWVCGLLVGASCTFFLVRWMLAGLRD